MSKPIILRPINNLAIHFNTLAVQLSTSAIRRLPRKPKVATWQLAKDDQFTDIVQELRLSPYHTEAWYVDGLEPDSHYYIRCIHHFSVDNAARIADREAKLANWGMVHFKTSSEFEPTPKVLEQQCSRSKAFELALQQKTQPQQGKITLDELRGLGFTEEDIEQLKAGNPPQQIGIPESPSS